jgi:DNA mismatch repair protein MutL
MPQIRQLPPSAVKELLENAVDVGATRIDIDLELGGAELIRVCDDGHGIKPG